ncbi:MAG: DUF488 domain-containing protein [Deltaproteobacteria bacterium]|nr:DUF488 domain-containing protein [Deltaproteobacteria bacterium]
MKTSLFTVGYEGRQLDEMIAALAAAKVDRLIDVRALPLSRRRGFSKTPLGNALRAAGIEYVHMREAGNPFRKEPDPIGQYRTHLPADTVTLVADAVRGHRAALLCYEADVETCHRGVLAPRVAKQLGLTAPRDL